MAARQLLRAVAARVISWIPDVRGKARLAWLVNRALLSQSNANSVVEAKMRLGYRMRVDLRAISQAPAFYTRDYDSEDIRSCLRLLDSDSVVLDVGANVGFWTVPMAMAVRSTGQVHAFEPLHRNCGRLQENLRLNGVDAVVTVHQKGLSDKPAMLDISLREDFSSGSDTGNAAIAIDESDQQFRLAVIEVDTLDQVFQSLAVQRLDFAKVDIEGHEDRFLRGASVTIARFRPVFFIEINGPYYIRRGLNTNDVFHSWLDSAQYTCAFRDSGGWRPAPISHRKPVIDNALLLPVERAANLLQRLNATK